MTFHTYSFLVFVLLTSLLTSCISSSEDLPTVTTKYGVDVSGIIAYDSVVVDIKADGKLTSHTVYLPANEHPDRKLRWDIVVKETKVIEVKSILWYQGFPLAFQSEVFTSGQAPSIPDLEVQSFPVISAPDTSIVYPEIANYPSAINVSVTHALSLSIDFENDGIMDTTISSGALSALTIENAKFHNAAVGSIYIAAVHIVDHLDRKFSRYFTVLARDKYSILVPTFQLPSSAHVYPDVPFFPNGIAITANATSPMAALTSMELDFESDGVADTTILSTGSDSLAITKASFARALTNQAYTAKVTVTDILGRSFSRVFSIATSNGLGDITTFTDPRDGQNYPYRRIGLQTWMLKNMNYSYGSSLCHTSDPTCATYGRYYQISGSICPAGWRIPHYDDWKALYAWADLANDGFVNLNADPSLASTTLWTKGGGKDLYGFAILPGGGGFPYMGDGNFMPLGLKAEFWTTALRNTGTGRVSAIFELGSEIMKSYSSNPDENSFNVRCILN